MRKSWRFNKDASDVGDNISPEMMDAQISAIHPDFRRAVCIYQAAKALVAFYSPRYDEVNRVSFVIRVS